MLKRCPESTSINLHVKDLHGACSHFRSPFKHTSLGCKQNPAVNFSCSCAGSYLTSRKTTGTVQSTQKQRTGILGKWQQISEQWGKVEEKEIWGEVGVVCSCQAVSSAQHPSPLCRCKIQEAAALLFKIPGKFFPPSSFCLVFVWMISSFISFLCPYAHSRIWCKNI